MSKPTCSSTTQEDDEPLLLDISTGRSVVAPVVEVVSPVDTPVVDTQSSDASSQESTAESSDSSTSTDASSSETQAPRQMFLCDLVRNSIAERQTIFEEKIAGMTAEMMFVFLNQVIPYYLADPHTYKGLSFDLEDEYRVLYRIPDAGSADITFDFVNPEKTVSHKVNITKEVYARLRQNLNNVRGMKCSRAIVKNTENIKSLPDTFDALVIDISKEGLIEYTDDDFKEPEKTEGEPSDSQSLKDPASLTVYVFRKYRFEIERNIDEHVTNAFNAIVACTIPHMLWRKEEYGDKFVHETEDTWFVALDLTDPGEPNSEEVRKYFVRFLNKEEKPIAEIDVTERVYERLLTRLANVKGATATREIYDLGGRKIPVFAMTINKAQPE